MCFVAECVDVFRETGNKYGSQIYEHAIKGVVVGLIPLKLHPKCFGKKENLVKKKRTIINNILSYLCLKNDLPGP